ncbi:hypothetical protein GO009_14735 [Muricauda sp. TY007]|uniref:hypothetical protein n=1 Tax=Allomuricauda sp. TY007 TaxID=2683200 RepID=UPI0013C1FDBF|nr:hypothetical protein [Muricauda sp. TY007]NDV17278.1 hypothetical protein [Muricauda sp. TY007]
MGCAVMCMFYIVGLFNGLVLETLHEVSHVLAPKTHHHNFTSDHEAIDYSSLEAMAGHSHEALEALKQLLEANQSNEQESKDDISFKLDKHFVEETHVSTEIKTLPITERNWVYRSSTSFWDVGVTTPPPQHS